MTHNGDNMKTNNVANWLLEDNLVEATKYITEAKVDNINYKKLIELGVDALFSTIQDELGVKTGDVASHFGDDVTKALTPILTKYIEAEMAEKK